MALAVLAGGVVVFLVESLIGLDFVFFARERSSRERRLGAMTDLRLPSC